MDKELFDISVDLKNVDEKFTTINLPTIYFRALNYEQFKCYMDIIMELHKRNFFEIEKITLD